LVVVVVDVETRREGVEVDETKVRGQGTNFSTAPGTVK
jgi:hypothetical protein